MPGVAEESKFNKGDEKVMDNCYKVIKKTVEDSNALCYVAPSQIPIWKHYIEFVEDFCKVYDYDPNLFAINVKKTSVEPLLKYKKDSEVYINTCRQIAAALKSKHGVTRKSVLLYMGQTPKNPPIKKTIEITPTIPRMVFKNKRTSAITAINQGLLNLLEPPVIQNLRLIMEREGLDNEYAALIRAVSNELKRSEIKK